MHGTKSALVWRARAMPAIATRLLRLDTTAEVAELDVARGIRRPGGSLRPPRYAVEPDAVVLGGLPALDHPTTPDGVPGGQRPDPPQALGLQHEYTSAADRLRETTKWMITAFALVGTLFAAGSQLSDLGAVDDVRRVLVAFGAAAAVLAGILFAIVAATTIFHPLEAGLSDLKRDARFKDYLRQHPDIFRQRASSLDEFLRKRRAPERPMRVPAVQRSRIVVSGRNEASLRASASARPSPVSPTTCSPRATTFSSSVAIARRRDGWWAAHWWQVSGRSSSRTRLIPQDGTRPPGRCCPLPRRFTWP